MTNTLIFGVDGLSHRVIQHMDEEQLPTIKQLQEETDAYGEFKSYVCEGYNAPHTGPCWTSMYTGLKPKDHGLTEGGWREGESFFNNMYTFWDKLADNGHDLVLYGMPMTYPANELNDDSWMVSGFVATTLKSKFYRAYAPDDLGDDLPDTMIKYTSTYVAKRLLKHGGHPDSPTPESYDILRTAEFARLDVFEDLIEKRGAPDDIVAYGTTFADKIGHIDTIQSGREYTQKTYEDVDEILARLIDLLDPDHVLIVSDHGFSGGGHDLFGYYLNTEGTSMYDLFEVAPHMVDRFGYEFDREEFGEIAKENDLSDEEKEDLKGALADLGYLDEEDE